MFEEGDLLVSLRNLNLLMVMSQRLGTDQVDSDGPFPSA